jgi:trigger factor
MQRQGIDPQTYFKLTNTTEDQLRSQLSANAAERVKTNLVLEAIAAKEGFEASKEEIDAEIKDLADNYNMSEKAVRNALSDEMLAHDISVRKAMDLITDSAKQVAKAKLEEGSEDEEDK